VIEPLRRSLDQRRDDASRKAAASKVEFFTVVRGE
jgi:alpha-D-ribose 1-methylphosphonate 5-triphosphate synthase subunit PhnG